MAITLNNNYQLISTIGLTYGEIRTYAKVNSQDNINNYTSYNLKQTYYLRQWIETSRWSANLDGSTTSGGYTRFNAGETTIIETSRTINHNNDGSSPTKNVYTGWSSGFGGSGESNVEIQMPKIDRLATITDVADFTDEENPVVYFTNPASMYVRAQLLYRKDETLYFFGEITNATSPCEITISDEQREIMRDLLDNNGTRYQVEVRLLSALTESSQIIGASTKNVNVNIINAEPMVDLNVVETNQKVINIYEGNDASIIVKNASELTLTSDVTLQKSASLRTRTYTFNGETKAGESFENVIPTDNNFSVDITDSRNLSAHDDFHPEIVDYIPVSINSYHFERSESTSSEIRLTADITYFQGTYNGIDNEPIIQYKMGAEGELRTLLTTDYSFDEEDNKISIYNLLLQDELVYTKSERFYLYVSDLFTEDAENEIVTKGIPTFEAGENDFQVNGDLYLADEDGNNPINVKNLVGGGGYDSLPVGSILPFSSENLPTGYLLCNGSEVSRSSYEELFEIIGTTFGQGNGTSTFNLPNLKGRVPVGKDTNQQEFEMVGKLGGSKYLQEHDHYIKDAGYDGGSSGDILNFYSGQVQVDRYMKTATAGLGDSENLQPYIVVNYIIKASGTAILNGNVVDSLEDNSTTNAPSQRAVNEKLGGEITTNGEPVKTGRVIDGKDEYVKRYSSAFNVGTASFGHGLTNITFTRQPSGYMANGDNSNLFPFPTLRTTFVEYNVEFYIASGVVQINVANADRTGYTAYVELYFTYND